MKLISSDGAWVELCPVAYQLPGHVGSSVDRNDWDANWLIIRCQVRTAQGREWAFEDPCLTTQESLALAVWLDEVATNEFATARSQSPDAPDVSFTEPVIAFSLDGYYAGHARLRMHFSLEGLPPWLRGRSTPSPYQWSIPLDIDQGELAGSVSEWRDECSEFPPR